MLVNLRPSRIPVILTHMSSSKTILGIDYGLKRVGLALGSTETNMAHAHQTLANDENLIASLANICQTEAVDQIVVGMPRGLASQPTEQTRITEVFVESLQQLGLPVDTRDEAVTSELARQHLGAKAPKEAIDAEAAAIILQDYLDEA